MNDAKDLTSFFTNTVEKTVELHFVGGPSFTGVVRKVLADALLVTEGINGPENIVAMHHIVRARLK